MSSGASFASPRCVARRSRLGRPVDCPVDLSRRCAVAVMRVCHQRCHIPPICSDGPAVSRSLTLGYCGLPTLDARISHRM